MAPRENLRRKAPAETKTKAKKPRTSAKAPVTKPKEPVQRQPRTRKTDEGVVLTCGQGDVGQLGLGPDIMEKKRLAVVPDLTRVVDISAGGMHTVCLTAEGDVYTFGCDDEGALGRMATDENSFTPAKVNLEGPAVQISAGDSHSAALLEDGRVFAWGSFRDSHGPMGLTGPNKPAKTPTLIKIGQPVDKIASGSDHLVLLTAAGSLYTCGCPEQGQLGRVASRSASRECRGGMTNFLHPSLVAFTKSLTFTDVWATSYGTFAKEKSQTLYCCGLNNYYQLGLEKELPIFRPLPAAALEVYDAELIKVAGGDHHSLLLNSSGKVFCLGRKEYGRLGLGTDAGDANKLTPVPLPANQKFSDIGCGSSVSFAVSNKGEVWGWGLGSNGQLSRGDDEEDVWEPTLLKAKVLEGKTVLLADGGGQHTVLLAKPAV